MAPAAIRWTRLTAGAAGLICLVVLLAMHHPPEVIRNNIRLDLEVTAKFYSEVDFITEAGRELSQRIKNPKNTALNSTH